MGVLRYGTPPESIEIDDRLLAHLQIVILTKLRRRESLSVSVGYAADARQGRVTLWIAPSVPLAFRYYESRRPAINIAWFDELMAGANSTEGLQLRSETDPVPRR